MEAVQADPSSMREGTRKALRRFFFDPRHSSDPEAVLRFSRDVLGMPGLTIAGALALEERDALRLIDALRAAFPDKTAAAAARAAEKISGRH
jgi:hypothetical protein